MRRAVGLIVLGVLAAAFTAASAHAGGGTTTGTATGTSTTTTTTTTTTTPSYSPLSLSSLPTGCVGAGAAALVPPSHAVIALGTPGTSLGASAYSTTSGTVLSFDSLTFSGSTCTSAAVTLSSVSLFGGVVTAGSVHAADGRGTVAGLEVDGAAVSAVPGQTVSVDGWGQLTLGATIGRVTAPLVLRLLQAHDSLAAGTAVVVAFAASAQPIVKPKPKEHQARANRTHATGSGRSEKHASGTHQTKHRGRQPRKPPGYPAAPSPFAGGGHFTDAVQDNPIVATALQYLGVPYQWGGTSPKTGFDCSGLVQYVFAQRGVPLVHFAAAQYRSPGSVWIPPDRLEPGDLVFFTGSDGTRKEPGHVGIYIGDGYMIDAPHTGAFVRIDSLDDPQLANQYVGAKKIVAPVDSRRLPHTTNGSASIPNAPLMLPLQMIDQASGVTTLSGAVPVAAHTAAPRSYTLWTGAGIGGALFLLLTGTFTYRRRRRPPERPSQAEGRASEGGGSAS